MSSRPAPTATGQFAKTPFAHLLIYVRERRLSGTLALQVAAGELTGETLLTFDRGGVTQVRFPFAIDTLGQLLLEMRAVEPAAVEESLLRRAAKQGLQGELLVRMGACTQKAVEQALAEQLQRKLRRIFDVPDATYAFYADTDLMPGYGGARSTYDVLPALWQGVRAHHDRPAVDAVLTKLGAQHLRLKTEHPDLGRFRFGTAEEAILDVLRFEVAPLSTLVETGADLPVVRSLVYALLITKVVEAVPPGTRMELGAASGAAIAAMPPPPPPVDLPSSTASYDDEPAVKGDDGRSALPAPLLKKLTEAEARFEAMQDENYYQMLGAQPKATADELRSAFMAQAAKWHPDKVGPGAPLVLDAYKKVFSLLNEAQNALADAEQRKRYDKQLTDGGGTPNAHKLMVATLEAATDVQKAEICLKRRDYVETEKLVRRALRAVPEEPSALLVLGQLLLEKSPNDAAASAEAEKVLTKAVELAPSSDRALVLLAGIHKRAGNIASARDLYKRASDANPKNMDAAREVRLLEMRERNRGGDKPEGAAGAPGVSALASKLTSGLSSLTKFVKKS